MIRKSSFRMFSDQIEYVVIVWRQEIGLRSKKCKEDDDDEQNNCRILFSVTQSSFINDKSKIFKIKKLNKFSLVNTRIRPFSMKLKKSNNL